MTKKTRARSRRFLRAFEETGSIWTAAKLTSMSRTSHYDWMTDAEYRQEFEAAKEVACDQLIEEARRRACGWEEPIVYQGKVQYELGRDGKKTPVTIRRYSDVLLMFLIKGLRPEVYRENYRVDVTAAAAVEQRNPQLAKLTLEQLKTLESWLTADADQEASRRVNGHAADYKRFG